MPKAKTNKERIADLEAEVAYLSDMIHALSSRIRGLENKPDPWRPIGPRPSEPSPFREPPLPWIQPVPREPHSPWTITCDTDDSKQG